jgi:GNAT superfamily N-acetyltransferase
LEDTIVEGKCLRRQIGKPSSLSCLLFTKYHCRCVSRRLVYWDSEVRRIRSLKNAAYVAALGVLPEDQGKGLGRKLMAYLEDYTRSQSKSEMCLHVRCSNTRAIAFYKRLGYIERGPVPYLSMTRLFSGCDRSLLMTRVVKSN